nr:MAG TPA: hypothetical protein [Caudoviricetes sp.]
MLHRETKLEIFAIFLAFTLLIKFIFLSLYCSDKDTTN